LSADFSFFVVVETPQVKAALLLVYEALSYKRMGP
jgi:hypothetical protein